MALVVAVIASLDLELGKMVGSLTFITRCLYLRPRGCHVIPLEAVCESSS